MLAGFMSFVIPGTGSFYAGNSAHGSRHLAIAGVAAIGMAASQSDCDFFSSGDGCTVVAAFAVAYVTNMIWATVVGASDASARNRSVRSAGLHFAPQLVAVRETGRPAVGLQMISYGF